MRSTLVCDALFHILRQLRVFVNTVGILHSALVIL